MGNEDFSHILRRWLSDKPSRTVDELIRAFPEKSIAVVIFVLMLLPATPLPTGGITHVFEIIALLGAVQLMLGRSMLWLPERLRQAELDTRSLRQLEKIIDRLSRWERRLSFVTVRLELAAGRRFVGVVLGLFILGAFLAPPFSGLDTLPALGAVLAALALVLDSAGFLAVGIILGTVGIGLEIALGRALLTALQRALGL